MTTTRNAILIAAWQARETGLTLVTGPDDSSLSLISRFGRLACFGGRSGFYITPVLENTAKTSSNPSGLREVNNTKMARFT